MFENNTLIYPTCRCCGCPHRWVRNNHLSLQGRADLPWCSPYTPMYVPLRTSLRFSSCRAHYPLSCFGTCTLDRIRTFIQGLKVSDPLSLYDDQFCHLTKWRDWLPLLYRFPGWLNFLFTPCLWHYSDWLFPHTQLPESFPRRMWSRN